MRNIIAVVGLFAVLFFLILSDFGQHGQKVYDCGMAEWHPDIPTKVKEECRRLRYEEWKRQQNDTRYRT